MLIQIKISSQENIENGITIIIYGIHSLPYSLHGKKLKTKWYVVYNTGLTGEN